MYTGSFCLQGSKRREYLRAVKALSKELDNISDRELQERENRLKHKLELYFSSPGAIKLAAVGS